MAKIIKRGFAKATDPIYSNGPEMFSPRASNPSSTSSAGNTRGTTSLDSKSALAESKQSPKNLDQK